MLVSFFNDALLVRCILNVSVINTRVECMIRVHDLSRSVFFFDLCGYHRHNGGSLNSFLYYRKCQEKIQCSQLIDFVYFWVERNALSKPMNAEHLSGQKCFLFFTTRNGNILSVKIFSQ